MNVGRNGGRGEAIKLKEFNKGQNRGKGSRGKGGTSVQGKL